MTHARLLSGAPNEDLFGFAQAVRAGPLVHVSGQVGKDNRTGAMVAESGLAPRLARTLRNVRDSAEGLGGPGTRLVALDVYLAVDPAAERETIAAALETASGGDAPATTLVAVEALASPDYLVEISATAVAGEEAAVQLVQDGSPLERAIGGSQAVRVGSHVYVAGQLSVDDDGALVPGSVAEQLDRALARFLDVLARAGARESDVVATTIAIAEPQDRAGFAAICDVHRAVFGEAKPSATLVFVPALPLDGATAQVSGIAVVDG
ncbi:MAG: Rid family hydrolase [Thermoleophilia bacterium]